MLIFVLFFCSGATALVYEVVWSKYLGLIFGSTVQSQSVVLAVFMGGLALGNRAFGRWADRLHNPLRIYGFCEIAIGLYAIAFPLIYKLADSAFVSVGGGLLNHAHLLLLHKALVSVTLLLGPTVLMGATLPILAAWLQRTTADPGRGSAWFYAINTLGAVCGTAAAGCFLVESFGL